MVEKCWLSALPTLDLCDTGVPGGCWRRDGHSPEMAPSQGKVSLTSGVRSGGAAGSACLRDESHSLGIGSLPRQGFAGGRAANALSFNFQASLY